MLTAGQKIGAYEIVAKLGAGGMGDVYRARDLRLARDVAIKVLTPLVAGDPDHIARFQREAQLLAALNHPNIAAIFGFEHDASIQFLVLELVDGETLATRLAKDGPFHLADAVAIARQIVDALEAAHEKGIIHRDLKPGNIMLTAESRVKVLDFGLAKALETMPSGDVAASPTLTIAATKAGVILGTAAYMAPEQAKGRLADKRCDVWSFGCVLYEMLSGRRAFQGEDLTDTIAAVVRGEPDWSQLPPDLPEHIRLLLRRCLEKDRSARLSDMGTARFLMNEPALSSMSSASVPQQQPSSARLPAAASRARTLTAAAAGLAGGIILAGGAAWTLTRPAPPASSAPVRFLITSPADRPIRIQNTSDDLAISSDGTQFVYRAGTGADTVLMIKSVSELEPLTLEGTEGAQNPFFSPDGKWIGFFNREQMFKVPSIGGAPILICRYPGIPRGASWADTDTIVFGTSDVTRGLLSVPAAGGEPGPVTTLEPGQADHVYPSFLPGGQAVLFSIIKPGTLESTIAVLDLATKAVKTIGKGFHAQYMEPGYIVYAADSGASLRAVRFDARALETRGELLTVRERALGANGNQKFAVSRNGVLLYAPDNGLPTVEFRTPLWVDRAGHEEPIEMMPRHSYAVPRISPDGTRIALDARDSGNDIWVWELARRTLSRLTNDPANDLNPLWTHDGRRIVFASSRNGNPNLYIQSADGTGTPERLTDSFLPQFPTSISPDQKRIVLFDLGAAPDILVMPLDGDRKAVPLFQTPSSELNGEISPDGRWLAYQSNESGISEVYVRPFPNVDGGRWTVSSGGGSRPAWSARGSELVYLDSKNLLTAVAVQSNGSTFNASVARTLLKTAYYPGFSITGADLRGYDVAADGQRFLMLKENQSTNATAPPLAVVLNWRETLGK